MNKMKKPKKYQVPQAIDISGGTAIGQVGPMGFCETGTSPSDDTQTCSNGEAPTQDPGFCAPFGFRPDRAKCLEGGSVAHGCDLGSLAFDG